MKGRRKGDGKDVRMERKTEERNIREKRRNKSL